MQDSIGYGRGIGVIPQRKKFSLFGFGSRTYLIAVAILFFVLFLGMIGFSVVNLYLGEDEGGGLPGVGDNVIGNDNVGDGDTGPEPVVPEEEEEEEEEEEVPVIEDDGGSSCFPAGTLISMAGGGYKAIENVKVGDSVVSYDEKKGDSVVGEVLELESPVRDHMCKIVFDDGTIIRLTDEHPIYTSEGWKSLSPKETRKENSRLSVSRLKLGDIIVGESNNVRIIDVSCEEGVFQTYNLKTIKNYNNFYADRVLVHNKGYMPSGGPDGSSCEILNAYWGDANVNGGDVVDIVVESPDCGSGIANLLIYSYNLDGGEDVLVDTITGITFADGFAVVLWDVPYYGQDSGGDWGGALPLPLLSSFSVLIFAFGLGFLGRGKRRKKIVLVGLVVSVLLIGFILVGSFPEERRISLAPGETPPDGFYFVVAADGEEIYQSNFMSFGPIDLTKKVLVIYNENYPDLDGVGEEGYGVNDALEIAEYYADVRGIEDSRLCGVQLSVGHYGTLEELLGARKKVIEECICNLIEESARPECILDNVVEIQEKSGVDHVAIIKGIPARLFNTPWPLEDNNENGGEPSFDFYFADSLAYDFGVYGSEGRKGAILPNLMKYSRIEAMTKDRTFDLIYRTLAAEQNGFMGNMFIEDRLKQYNYLNSLVETYDLNCWDYLENIDPDNWPDENNFWHNEGCERLGTTSHEDIYIGGGTTFDDVVPPYGKQIPGELESGEIVTVIPYPLNAGLFLGAEHLALGGRNDYTRLTNLHHAFDGFSNMLNWHKSDIACVELCEEFGTQEDIDNCIVNSEDYLKEINTDCVGVAPGFMAFQYRSFPVQYYGFMPKGGGFAGGGGADDRTIPEVLEESGNHYLHYGEYNKDITDSSTCILEDTSVVDCKEHIAISLASSTGILNFPLEINNVGKEYKLKFRYRTRDSQGGGLNVGLKFSGVGDSVSIYDTTIYTLDESDDDWVTLESDPILIKSTDFSGSPSSFELRNINFLIRTDLDKNVKDYIDFDDFEILDVLDNNNNVFSSSWDDFEDVNYKVTNQGDWASNVIDRLGGVASWGSSSHFLTGGHAFKDAHEFAEDFFSGKTLGESVSSSAAFGVGGPESGIIYGDPLYRLVASKIYFEDYEDEFRNVNSNPEPHHVWVDTYQDLNLKINAFNGKLIDSRWEVSRCDSLDYELCDGLWEIVDSGNIGVYDFTLGLEGLFDSSQESQFTLKVKSWNINHPDDYFVDYVYVWYFMEEYSACQGDIDMDGYVDEEDLQLLEYHLDIPGGGRCLSCLPTDIEDDVFYCVADVDGNGLIDTQDQNKVNNLHGTTCSGCPEDIDGDGDIDDDDISIVVEYWGCVNNGCPIDGEGWCSFDINRDGVVDSQDYDSFFEPKDNCFYSDADDDGIDDIIDVCSNDFDNDADGDSICGDVDNCPGESNPDQRDADDDGLGDLCDDDIDGDGELNVDDNCPYEWNPGQEDMNGDGEGDVCDDDIDGDGTLNEEDSCPFDVSLGCISGNEPVINDYSIDVNYDYLNYWMKKDQNLPIEILDCSSSGVVSYRWTVDGGLHYLESHDMTLFGASFGIGNHKIIGYCEDENGMFDRVEFNVEVIGENDFAIVALPDTQVYSESFPEIFYAQTQWVVDLSDRLDIVFVSHLGDVVDDGALGQWENAHASMSILDDNGERFGIALGNHDELAVNFYDQFFPVSRYENMGGFGDSRLSGTASGGIYQYFEKDGREFMIIHYPYCPTDEELDWVNDIVGTNLGKQTIATTHLYMKPGTLRSDDWCSALQNDGDEQWENFAKNHENLFLVLSGHYGGNGGYRVDFGDNGNLVHQIISDYQHISNGGNGYLDLMIFRPDTNRIDFKVYSPYIDLSQDVDAFRHGQYEEFSIDYDFDFQSEVFAYFTADPEESFLPTVEIDFDASSSTGGQGDIVDYSWDFGDGEIDSGMEVTHQYPLIEDTYFVTLTVTNNLDEQDDFVREIILRNTACSDEIDNDNDGEIDFSGGDTGCISAIDDEEFICIDADLDGDGDIDDDDLNSLVWRICGEEESPCTGDFNNDGLVGQQDHSRILNCIP